MVYRIDLRLPLEGEIRRILAEELAGVVAELRSEARSRDDAIHEARKHLKKARALLRLLRPFLGDAYAWENDVCRGAARMLAGARDAAAMVEAVERLRSTCETPDVWRALETRMGERARARLMSTGDEARILGAIEERLSGVQVRLRAWSQVPSAPSDLAAGAARVLRSGRRRYRTALRRGDAESVHAWRKRTKDLWYHARLLRGLDPLLAGWEASIDRLAEVLGQRHDLDVLDALLRAEPDLLEGSDAPRLFAEIAARRHALDGEAALLGEVIYEGGAPDLARLLSRADRVLDPPSATPGA